MAMFDSNNKNIMSIGNKVDSQSLIVIPINDHYIKRMIMYAVSPSRNIKKKHYRNLQELVNLIDIEGTFPEATNMKERQMFIFLKELVRLIVEDKVNNQEMVVGHFIQNFASSDNLNNDILELCLGHLELGYNINNMTEYDIELITSFISDNLTYSFIYREYGNLKNILDNVVTGEMSSSYIKNNVAPLFTRLNSSISTVRSTSKHETDDFIIGKKSTESEALATKDIVIDKIKRIKSPSNKLKSGYQLLNSMVNGGFESGRVYTFLGPTKGFKSGVLINLGLTIARNNSTFETKRQGAIPLVVYLTMENDSNETYARIFEYIAGVDLETTPYPPDVIYNTVESYLSNNEFMSIKIMYRPTGSITTEYLNSIIDDAYNENYEVVTIIQDYVKRIAPSSSVNRDDLRISLGNIVDEFSTIAKKHQIPILTAAQLNRETYRVVEESSRKNSVDIAKMFGTSNVAESAQIVENSDYSIIINREDVVKDPNTVSLMEEQGIMNKTFVSFKLGTSRGKAPSKANTYFAQPFENGFKIVEDINDDKPKASIDIASYLNDGSDIAAFTNGINNINNTAATMPQMNGHLEPTQSFLNNNQNNMSMKPKKPLKDDDIM